MRVAIIALVLSIAALGIGSFATFRSFDSDEATLVAAEATWSEAECERANARLKTLEIGCIKGDCDAYNDMLQAINDNCE